MTTTQTDEIKTWQQRLEETCPALGPMHIHACVEEVNDAMQAEINDLRVALQEQAREGEAVAWLSAVLDLIDDCPGLTMEQDAWLSRRVKELDFASAPQPAQPSEPAQPEQGEREAFERHWVATRGKKKASRELQRHSLQPQCYVQDSANRHWVTWQAALQSAQPVALPLTPEELNLCRQWFDFLQDTNAEYLEPSDYLLAEKIYKQLNMRVPNSISEITKSGIGGAL